MAFSKKVDGLLGLDARPSVADPCGRPTRAGRDEEFGKQPPRPAFARKGGVMGIRPRQER
jgi:hypothetical protein